MMPVPKKKKPMDNYKVAFGFGVDWADMDRGILYHIREYRDALRDPKVNPKPTKIRMTRLSDGTEIGWEDEYIVSERMRDPKPDPRYEPETPKEHRRSF